MYNLLFDIGNSRTKWAVSKGSDLLATGAIANAAIRRDGTTALSRTINYGEISNQLDSVWAAAVGGREITQTVNEWVSELKSQGVVKKSLQVLNSEKKTAGMTNYYEEPSTLGVDRWLAALGARRHFPNRNLIIIDAGTTITIDWVDRYSGFQGGAILPGAELMMTSLTANTEKIEAYITDTSTIVGRSTLACTNIGVQRGLPGAIEVIVTSMCNSVKVQKVSSGNTPLNDRLESEAKPLGLDGIKVIITGGSAEKLKPSIKICTEHFPNLIFIGMLEMIKIKEPFC